MEEISFSAFDIDPNSWEIIKGSGIHEGLFSRQNFGGKQFPAQSKETRSGIP